MKSLEKLMAAALMAFAIVLSPSCSKDDDPEEPEKEYKMEDIVLPMTFDKFLSNEDVVIENSDTSSILVSKAFLDQVVKKEIIPDLSYLAVWLKPNQYPFYRLVTGAEDLGDGRVRLATEPADVSCCLPEGEFTLNTDIYRNEAEKPRMNGSGSPINSDYYFDPINREYHPVAIFLDSTGQTPLDNNDSYEINFESLPSPLIEEYFKQLEDSGNPDNWTINPSLSVSFATKDKYLGKEEDKSKIGLENAVLKATAGFRLTLDVGVHMKKKKIGIIPIYYPVPYIQEFAASGSYGFNAEYNAISEMRGTKKFGDDYVLFKVKAINSVFMLGPVPLLVSADPEFIFRCKGEMSGGIGVRSIGKMEISREQGIRYKGGKWSPIENKKPFTRDIHTGFNLNGQLSGQLGMFLKIPVKLDKLAGPFLSVGGQVEAKAEGIIMFEVPKKSEFPSVDFKAAIDMWVGAEFGAELEFMKWKLTSPKIQFKILQENLLTWPEKNSVAVPEAAWPDFPANRAVKEN